MKVVVCVLCMSLFVCVVQVACLCYSSSVSM